MRGQKKRSPSEEIVIMLENEQWDHRLRLHGHVADGEKFNWDFAMGFDAALDLITKNVRIILARHR